MTQMHHAQARRRGWIALAGALLAATLGGCSGSASTSVSESPDPDPSSALPRLGSDLGSGDSARMASALDPATRAALADPKAVLPTGANITFDPGTLQVTGDSATVTAAVSGTGTAHERVTAVLHRNEGRWRVVCTVPG